MRIFPALRIGVLIAAAGLCVQGQTTPGKEAPKEAQSETKGLPPRTAPGEYQAHAKAGAVTIGAEFKGHSIPTMQGTLTTEDYVIVEIGMFGAPDAKLVLALGDWSLRVNGKKTPLESQPYGLVIRSVKDPEYEAPVPAKSKTSLGGGGQEAGEPAPSPPPIPIGVQRAMAQRVQKSSLPEGDRPLPQAGLIFFQYRGKTKGIHSLELIYAGAAGKATLTLQTE